jgi:hypothetical protein
MHTSVSAGEATIAVVGVPIVSVAAALVTGPQMPVTTTV